MQDIYSHREPGQHTMQQTLYAERDPMINRGDLYSACLDPVVGSEQGGIRPVLVIQNDVGNRHSPTVIVLAVTGQINKARLPTHVPVPAEGNGLMKDSVILAEQIRTLDKRRLRERIGAIECEARKRADDLERATVLQLQQTLDLFRQQYQTLMSTFETTASHVNSELRKVEVNLSQLPRTMDRPGAELNELAQRLEQIKQEKSK